MIKAVLFDVGGTLLFPHPSVGHIYSEIAAKHNIILSPDDLNHRFKQAWTEKKVKKQLVDKEWWKELVKQVCGTDSFFEDLYQTFEEKHRWKIKEGAVDLLKSLKAKGLTLAIASNWDERLPALLKTMNLTPYFDHQFISSQIGCLKSNPTFFKTCLQALNLPPEQVLHIGDDPEEDIHPAKQRA